jgi:septum formation protein
MKPPDRARLVLASASRHRATLLHHAGIDVEIEPARIDERAAEAPLAGADPGDIAMVLAQAKAGEVSSRMPARHVIGCDQVLSLEGKPLHKPVDMEAARRRLLALAGRQHVLDSAVCLATNGEVIWSHVETATIRFRNYDPGFVGRHLAAVGEAALTSVGAYQIEGRGIQLMDRIDGDYFSIIGLPLLPLLAKLRELGLIDG